MKRRRSIVTEPVVAATYAHLDRQSLNSWLRRQSNLGPAERDLLDIAVRHFLDGETLEELGERFEMPIGHVQAAVDNATGWMRQNDELMAALGRGKSHSCPFHGESWITANHLTVECPECPCPLPKLSAYDGAPNEFFCSASCAFRVMDRIVEQLAVAVERQSPVGWNVAYRQPAVDPYGHAQARPQVRLSRVGRSGSAAPEIPLVITSQGWGPSGLTIEGRPRTTYCSEWLADAAQELWIVWPDSTVEVLRRRDWNGRSQYVSVGVVKGGEQLELNGSISLRVSHRKRAVCLNPYLTREPQ